MNIWWIFLFILLILQVDAIVRLLENQTTLLALLRNKHGTYVAQVRI